MKSRMFLTLCSTLVLALLKSVPSAAQAEMAPDHFDSPNTEVKQPASNAVNVNPAGSFSAGFSQAPSEGYT